MMAGTWESLKVNTARKLLVGTGVPFLEGTGYLSVYDISDCAHPRLLNPGPGTNLAMPLPITTHEGGFSPTAGPIGPRASHPASSARSTSPIRRIRT